MWHVKYHSLRLCWYIVNWNLINSLRPRLNRRPIADDIFKCIFLNENEWILLRISLKFVLKVRINNIPSLVQIMAWRRPGDKPLSEPMVVSLLTHICVTRSQWVNQLRWNWNQNKTISIQENLFANVVCKVAVIFLGNNVLSLRSGNAYMTSFIWIIACRIFDKKPLLILPISNLMDIRFKCISVHENLNMSPT